jgi:hypothetical protein
VITQGTVSVGGNYTLDFNPEDVTINVAKKAVTVTANAQSKIYGDADPLLTYTVIGSLKSGDSFTGALGRVTGENVNTYDITQGGLALNSNYSLTFIGAKLTINEKAVTVTADAQSKIYGDADPLLTHTVTSGSLKSGDSFTGALGRVAGENVNTYDITQGGLALNSNYSLTFIGAKLTINTKVVTFTPVSGQTAEIGSGYKVQVSVVGLFGTDTYTGDAAFTDEIGDTQPINVGSLAIGSNYSLDFKTGVTIKVVAQLPISLTFRATNGSVDLAGNASIGTKIEVTAAGGGAGALTWSAPGCSLSAVSTSGSSATQTIQKNGAGSCKLTVKRAASGTRVASEIFQTFTWSNK